MPTKKEPRLARTGQENSDAEQSAGNGNVVEFRGHQYRVPAYCLPRTVLDCLCHPDQPAQAVTPWDDDGPELEPYVPFDLDLAALALEEDDLDGRPGGHELRLGRGDAYRVRVLPSTLSRQRIARHPWIGARLVCTRHTSPDLLPEKDRGRACPLCDLVEDQDTPEDLRDRLRVRYEWRVPVMVLDRVGGVCRHNRSQPYLLRLNERQFKQAKGMGERLWDVVVEVGREDDEWGSYFIRATDERLNPLDRRPALPPFPPARPWDEKPLASLAATIKAAGWQEPERGRVEYWRAWFPDAGLVACVWGTKKPTRSGYPDPAKVSEWMRDEHYLRRMDEGACIALLLAPPYASVDLDVDEDVEEFLNLNPWTKDALRIIGGRGCKFIVRMAGDYPRLVLHAKVRLDNGRLDDVGEFRGDQLAMLDGLHKSGRLYSYAGNQIPEIAYSDIRWPAGWILDPPREKREHKAFDGEPVEGGLLDLRKLRNVQEHPRKAGAHVAQCPACLERNSDRSGDHLIIYEDGRYGCVTHADDPEHRSRILALAGRDDLRKRSQSRALIEELASLDPVEYDKVRKEKAEELGIRVSTLDASVAAKRTPQDTLAGSAVAFTDPEPWPSPVDGADLLGRIFDAFTSHLVLSEDARLIASLWVMATYCADAFRYAAILHFKSPEKRCGKSTALDLLRLLVRRPLLTGDASAPALFRAISEHRPTLLLDEFDSMSGSNPERAEAFRGILNCCYERSRHFLRCDGQDNDVRIFDVYAFVAVASIGDIPETAADRALVIEMHRRGKTEVVKRLRDFAGQDIPRMCARWAVDNAEALTRARPEMPEELDDRRSDIAAPLVAIADLIAPSMGIEAREVLCRLAQPQSTLVQKPAHLLLADVLDLFTQFRADVLRAEDIIGELSLRSDRPWRHGIAGKPFNALTLAEALRPWGVRPGLHRGVGRGRARGYAKADVAKAVERYVVTDPDAEGGQTEPGEED